MAVSKLKNGEATEHDQILAEFSKKGGKELKKVIKKMGGADHITCGNMA